MGRTSAVLPAVMAFPPRVPAGSTRRWAATATTTTAATTATTSTTTWAAARSGAGASASASRPRRAALRIHLIRHARSLIWRNLLDTRPPLRRIHRCEAVLGSQQQQVVRGTEARMLDHA